MEALPRLCSSSILYGCCHTHPLCGFSVRLLAYHACAHTSVRWSGCICIFCAGRCMKFQENWSQYICSCTTHNVGLSGSGLTHPHKRVHHDHASICGICRVLDRSAGIGHFSRVDVYSSLGPCRFSRLDVFNLAPLDTISTMAHTTASRFLFPFSKKNIENLPRFYSLEIKPVGCSGV